LLPPSSWSTDFPTDQRKDVEHCCRKAPRRTRITRDSQTLRREEKITLWDRINGKMNQFRNYVKITEADEIGRRYFIKNGFDGALTILGIIIGTFLADVHEPKIVIGAGVGATLAMGMSGLFGTYLTERAERTRNLKRLERAMVTNLDKTVWDEASTFVTLWAAIIDGLSPALVAILAVMPFVAAHLGMMDFYTALVSSLVIIAITLFLMGSFIGKIAGENPPVDGLKMLSVGILTGIVVILLSMAEAQGLAWAGV
jgi:predicted membrane protein (TIGR00267 family)